MGEKARGWLFNQVKTFVLDSADRLDLDRLLSNLDLDDHKLLTKLT